MRKFIIAFLTCLSLTGFSQTQAEMNQDAWNTYTQADCDMQDVYSHLLAQNESDELFVENLQNSQDIWTRFRDAELELKFPNYGDNRYGSMQPLCRAFFLKDLTEERISRLKALTKKDSDTDACN